MNRLLASTSSRRFASSKRISLALDAATGRTCRVLPWPARIPDALTLLEFFTILNSSTLFITIAPAKPHEGASAMKKPEGLNAARK
jgi:hypothetical protein